MIGWKYWWTMPLLDRSRNAVAGVPMSGRPQPARRTAHLRVDTTWQSRAACIGSSIEFVPVPSDLRSELHAKQICAGCAVRLPCLEDALATGAAGVRGGRTEAEREWMRQGRRRASTCR